MFIRVKRTLKFRPERKRKKEEKVTRKVEKCIIYESAVLFTLKNLPHCFTDVILL